MTMMTMLMITTTTTTIFPRKRRDIFLLYYVKSECTLVMIRPQDRTYDIFPSQLICASRSIAGDLPLFFFVAFARNIRLFSLMLMKTLRCSKIRLYNIFFHLLSLYNVHTFDYRLFHLSLLYFDPCYSYDTLFRSISIAFFLALRNLIT